MGLKQNVVMKKQDEEVITNELKEMPRFYGIETNNSLNSLLPSINLVIKRNAQILWDWNIYSTIVD